MRAFSLSVHKDGSIQSLRLAEVAQAARKGIMHAQTCVKIKARVVSFASGSSRVAVS